MAVILPKQTGTEEGKLLFRKSEIITGVSEGIKIVKNLKDTLDYYGGVGLAAPQIGISRKVFIVNIVSSGKRSELPDIGFKAYINPEILDASSETNTDFEGCLSVFYSTLHGQVGRPSSLKIKYMDIEGKKRTEDIYHPFHARVILHENDHLDGKVFLQRMKAEDFPNLHWEENLDIRKKY